MTWKTRSAKKRDGRDRVALDKTSCMSTMLLSLAATAAGSTPASAVPIETLTVITRPARSIRSALMPAPADLSQPLTFQFICRLGTDGELNECLPAARAASTDQDAWGRTADTVRDPLTGTDRVERIAMRRLADWRVDMTALPASRVPVYVRVAETVSPADALVLPVKALVDRNLVGGIPSILPETSADLYPPPARRGEVTATVAVRCEIQRDGELWCVDPRVIAFDPPNAQQYEIAGFPNATLRALARPRAELRLKDGRSAIGQQAEFIVYFRLRNN